MGATQPNQDQARKHLSMQARELESSVVKLSWAFALLLLKLAEAGVCIVNKHYATSRDLLVQVYSLQTCMFFLGLDVRNSLCCVAFV